MNLRIYSCLITVIKKDEALYVPSDWPNWFFKYLTDSISNVLGKNVKVIYKSLIRMESRGDKVDNKVLVSFLNEKFMLLHL